MLLPMPMTVRVLARRIRSLVFVFGLSVGATHAGPAGDITVQRWFEHDGSPVAVTRDPASGAVRALRGAALALPGGRTSPAAALRDWMSEHRAAFGLVDGVSDELRVARDEPLPGGRHRVQLRQYWRGLPVDGADARGIVDADGRLCFVAAGFRALRSVPAAPLTGAAAAVATAARVGGGEPVADAPELWVRDAGDHDGLAWRVVFVHPDGRQRVAWVDASDGRLLVADTAPAHALGFVYPSDPAGPLVQVALERLLPDAGLRSAAFTIEDVLHPEAVPAGPDGDYRFAPAHPSFDQVNVYWHADRFLHDYLGGLGYAGPPESLLIRVNMPTEPFVAQTSGRFVYLGRPIAGFVQEVARCQDIIYHELTHAVIYGAGVSSSGPRREAVALHEGLADYFTAAFTGDPGIGQWLYLTFPNGATRVDQPSEPWNYDHYDRVGFAGGEAGSPWGNGMILSATLWDLRASLGKSADSLVLESLVFLPESPVWSQFANALLEADHEHHAGRWQADIVRTLLQRRIHGAVEVGIDGPASLAPGVAATFRARPCCGSAGIGEYRWQARSWCRGRPCSDWRELGAGAALQSAFEEDSELRLTVMTPWADTLVSVPFFVGVRPPVLQLSGPRTIAQRTAGTWSARVAAVGPAAVQWTRTWRRPLAVPLTLGHELAISFVADTSCDLEVVLVDGLGRRVVERRAIESFKDKPPSDRTARFMAVQHFDVGMRHGELTLELTEPAPVVAVVYDVRGRARARIWDGPLSRGVHIVRWDAAALEPGIYFLRVTTSPRGTVLRFAVLR